MVIRVKTANHWWTGAVVVEAYHNPVKMEQRVNKFRTYTSAFVNLVGQAKYVTWKWCPVTMHLCVKVFDGMFCVIMVVSVKTLVIVIGAIVPMVIPVAIVRKKSTNVIQHLVKMEQRVEI